VRFSSRDELLERLRSAIHGFDEIHLLETSEATGILFAELVELSDAQLSSLGLTWLRKSAPKDTPPPSTAHVQIPNKPTISIHPAIFVI
jgi:hypothetical protein